MRIFPLTFIHKSVKIMMLFFRKKKNQTKKKLLFYTTTFGLGFFFFPLFGRRKELSSLKTGAGPSKMNGISKSGTYQYALIVDVHGILLYQMIEPSG